MTKLEEETGAEYIQDLIDSENYEDLVSYLITALKESFYEKTFRIKSLKYTSPSFNAGDLTRCGEIMQLKEELSEFINLLREVFYVSKIGIEKNHKLINN